MRDALHRCIRWRRIRASNCSFRSGSRTELNFISNFPPTTRAVITDSSLCSGVPGCACTRSVTDVLITSVPSACGMAVTGSNLSGLSGGFIDASLPGASNQVTVISAADLPRDQP